MGFNKNFVSGAATAVYQIEGAWNEHGIGLSVWDQIRVTGPETPLALYTRGGWLSPDSLRWFAECAGVQTKRFGDRIQNWMTLNEPQMFIGLGHYVGCHAPGLKLPKTDIVRMIHPVLLSRGRAVQVR